MGTPSRTPKAMFGVVAGSDLLSLTGAVGRSYMTPDSFTSSAAGG